MAVVAGRPTLYLRQPTDTIKGRMWADVGLADTLLETATLRPGDLTSVFMAIHDDYDAAVGAVASARDRASDLLWHMATTAMRSAATSPAVASG